MIRRPPDMIFSVIATAKSLFGDVALRRR